MSNLTPVASWDAVIQLDGTMAGVPATWNTPNQALLNRTQWLNANKLGVNANGDFSVSGVDCLWTITSSGYYGGITWYSTQSGSSKNPAKISQYYGSGLLLYGAPKITFITSNGDTLSAPTAAALIDGLGNFQVTLPTGSIGYGTGAGGTVTQATSKATPVTLSKPSGQITTSSAALAAGALVSFVVTNTLVAVTDTVTVNLKGGNATAGTYRVWAEAIAAGSFVVCIENRSGGSLSEALVLNVNVFKGANA